LKGGENIMKKILSIATVITALVMGLGLGINKVHENCDPGTGKPTDPPDSIVNPTV
jgi:hypothetical protein